MNTSRRGLAVLALLGAALLAAVPGVVAAVSLAPGPPTSTAISPAPNAS